MKNQPTSLSRRLHVYEDPEKYIEPEWKNKYKKIFIKLFYLLLLLSCHTIIVFNYVRNYYVSYYKKLFEDFDSNYLETITHYNTELDKCVKNILTNKTNKSKQKSRR
ncbi:MAG: hypothetical protein ABIK31_02070 [candidate division WOR-3 bacterium]